MFNPLKYTLCFDTPRLLTSTSAWERHIPFAFSITQMHRPRVIVELGTHKGDSYCAFCQAAVTLGLETRCYAVDHWEGDEHSGELDSDIFRELKAYHDPLYGAFSQLMKCTFDEALPRFANGSIDLLHIDGFHTYDAVKHDFESWLPKLSSRGVVLFHDTEVRERDFGVWKLWNELQGRYPSFEFKHGYGLGVLGVGVDIETGVRELFQANDEQAKVVGDFFSHAGHRVALLGAYKRYEQLQQEHAHMQSVAAEQVTQLHDLNRRYDQLQQEHAHAQSVAAEHDTQLRDLNRRYDQLQQEHSRTEEVVSARDKEIAYLYQWQHDILNSHSWKLTAPLRWLVLQAYRIVGTPRRQ
jgi:hypothetical protein